MILTKLSRCPRPAGSWCRSERSLSLCLCDVCCLWPGWSCTASWVVISLSLLQSQHRLLASLCRPLSLSLSRDVQYSSTPLLLYSGRGGTRAGRGGGCAWYQWTLTGADSGRTGRVWSGEGSEQRLQFSLPALPGLEQNDNILNITTYYLHIILS